MVLEALDSWVGSGSLLLSSGNHGNTSATLTRVLHCHIKQNRTVSILHHHGDNTVQHYNTLLGKCSIDASALVTSSKLNYTTLPCFLDSAPDLDVLYNTLSKCDVAVVTELHVLPGLGCALRDVILLIQKLLRKGVIVIATTRVAPETLPLNTLLAGLLGDVTTLVSLESGASQEVDGHITWEREGGLQSRCLYKGSEKGVKLFPMGAAPGTV